jgi:hypothetical protein
MPSNFPSRLAGARHACRIPVQRGRHAVRQRQGPRIFHRSKSRRIGAYMQFDRKMQEQQGLGLGSDHCQAAGGIARRHVSIESDKESGTVTRQISQGEGGRKLIPFLKRKTASKRKARVDQRASGQFGEQKHQRDSHDRREIRLARAQWNFLQRFQQLFAPSRSHNSRTDFCRNRCSCSADAARAARRRQISRRDNFPAR